MPSFKSISKEIVMLYTKKTFNGDGLCISTCEVVIYIVQCKFCHNDKRTKLLRVCLSNEGVFQQGGKENNNE